MNWQNVNINLKKYIVNVFIHILLMKFEHGVGVGTFSPTLTPTPTSTLTPTPPTRKSPKLLLRSPGYFSQRFLLSVQLLSRVPEQPGRPEQQLSNLQVFISCSWTVWTPGTAAYQTQIRLRSWGPLACVCTCPSTSTGSSRPAGEQFSPSVTGTVQFSPSVTGTL